jgi:hypothetical protein
LEIIEKGRRLIWSRNIQADFEKVEAEALEMAKNGAYTESAEKLLEDRERFLVDCIIYLLYHKNAHDATRYPDNITRSSLPDFAVERIIQLA